MVRMRIRPVAITSAAALAAVAVAVIALNRGRPSTSPSTQRNVPAPTAAVPTTPRALSNRLSATDLALRRAIDAWRANGGLALGAPPEKVTRPARYMQRALRLLSYRSRLAEATIRRLPAPLASETRQVTAALHDLHRLSAGWPAHRVRIGPPDPLGRLLDYYRAAERRFGVRWQVLAAVNFVESAFGRLRSRSVAGAQGPMQFIPSTWRIYGLGGNVSNPRDAILGAANLLRHSGAPDSYTRALYAYNPSPLYVDAVRRYSHLIARERDGLYLLYSWHP
jgi:membrane-bound lytic murein transglycosylase B